ncbi:MAG TPA: endonuclease III [Syntrophales bacterium]|nr:endonuclease III [Syntrophales bacterium]
MKDKDIHAVMRLLERELEPFGLPPVSAMAEEDVVDPFRILVSTIISARTKDEVTGPAAKRLFALAASPSAMSALPEEEIEKAIFPAGFYRTKAKAIRKASREIVERFGSRVPDSIEALLTLPGVGRKTANLVVTLAHSKAGICVDTHVHRITNRWGYVKTKTPRETEQALRAKLPRRHWIRINTLLVMHGQNICRPVSPFCSRCPVFPYCARIGVTKSR